MSISTEQSNYIPYSLIKAICIASYHIPKSNGSNVILITTTEGNYMTSDPFTTDSNGIHGNFEKLSGIESNEPRKLLRFEVYQNKETGDIHIFNTGGELFKDGVLENKENYVFLKGSNKRSEMIDFIENTLNLKSLSGSKGNEKYYIECYV